MLHVLKGEFKDFVPFETDHKVLEMNASDELAKFKENSFIELIDQTVQKDAS